MKLKSTVIAFSTALGASMLSQYVYADPAVKSVEFIGMPAPSSLDERADIYTKAQMKVAYKNGKSKTYDLKYHQLMATTEVIKGNVVGGLWDHNDAPIYDDLHAEYGQMASDAPDGNSLMDIPGTRAAHPWKSHALAMVTHFEYREVPPGYPDYYKAPYASYWSKLPATMGLSKIDQDKTNGMLAVVDYDHIHFAGVNGGWIHCAASLSPWNTHLGSEEYEPDAKTREGLPRAADDTSNPPPDIESFSNYYFGDPAKANAYHYGLVPEVKVHRNGSTTVVKHYALGRIARELADVQPDGRTAYMGDDGGYTGLFMFVADRKGDLSKGTLYAAKWKQTSEANGGSANLSWIRLGHASDQEIKDMVDGGITFHQIFDVINGDAVSVGYDPAADGYKKVKTYTGTEWLRLRTGVNRSSFFSADEQVEKAAAFLETRRYAATLGATTEFSKMEGVTHNAKDKKAYVVISRVETGMTDIAGDPQNDVRVARNDGGAIYELDLAGGQKDTDGHRIPSEYVAKTMASIPELLGGWLGLNPDGSAKKDNQGNRCLPEKVCGGDNLKYAANMRTLFIGEDTSRRNNNYVWAFNLDTHKLSRILSVPMYAEATGLQAVEDLNGSSYIMSNFQHPGEKDQEGEFKGAGSITEADVLNAINAKWDNKKKAAIGYIGTEDGALPAIK